VGWLNGLEVRCHGFKIDLDDRRGHRTGLMIVFWHSATMYITVAFNPPSSLQYLVGRQELLYGSALPPSFPSWS
jgi:hypothetical protein